MNTFRHIFLTGEKQVGKSTLWKKALEQSGISPSGFQTLEYLVNGNFRGYRLHSLGPVPEQFGNDVPISVFLRRKMHLPVAESFEVFGTELLRLALEKGGCILMDELGSFERNSPAFRKAVLDCLDGKCHVLGVLQKVEDPFLEEIMNRPDVRLFTVTQENRDHLVLQVMEALEQLK